MWKLQIKSKQFTFLIIAYLLTIIVAASVYLTGGTHNAATNFMNIPIIIAAFSNGRLKGTIHAIISGILVGPYMPLLTVSHTPQPTLNWVIRTLYYIIIAFIAGSFAEYYKMEFEKNNKIEKEISESHLAMIYALVKLTESRDDDTGAHIERVSELCRLLTEKLSHLPKYADYINESYIDNMHKASPLHDIGKVGIPDSILLKPGKLEPEEFEKIKQHTVIGYKVLSEIQRKYPSNKFLELGNNIVYYHHEKWDGSGYPKGLSQESIPLSARIMALVDVYDALRSKRIYKEPYSHEDSIQIILEGKGKHFDPEIVDVFMENEEEFCKVFDRITAGLTTAT
jgi:HD-GYP domain-containing protein (c-di-GMP phosphodiesterase class II)